MAMPLTLLSGRKREGGTGITSTKNIVGSAVLCEGMSKRNNQYEVLRGRGRDVVSLGMSSRELEVPSSSSLANSLRMKAEREREKCSSRGCTISKADRPPSKAQQLLFHLKQLSNVFKYFSGRHIELPCVSF